MSDLFDFQSWCKKFNLRESTIKKLDEEAYTDQYTLPYLAQKSIIAELKIQGGEELRIIRAVSLTFPDIVTDILVSSGSPGNIYLKGFKSAAQVPPVAKPQIPEVTVKPDPDAKVPIPPPTGQGVPDPNQAEGGVKIPATTGSLARDKDVNAVVDRMLAGITSGVNDTLTLGDLKSNSDPRLRGKPLLIADFLTSNINVCYSSQVEQEINLPGGAKIVFDCNTKKPAVTSYTPEVWSAANSRILRRLIRLGAHAVLLDDYLEYSSMIADYMSLYVHKGVFRLDYEHRLRVAAEGCAWRDILSHDKDKFLFYNHDTRAQDTSVETPVESPVVPKKSKKVQKPGKPRKVLDSNNVPVCFGFNSNSGCENGPSCQYSHCCYNCLGSHTKLECPKLSHVGPRLRGK